MEKIRTTIGIAMFALAFAVPSVAAAGGGALYDWSAENAPVLVTTDSGVLFVGNDRKVRRAYSWSRSTGEHKRGLYVVDLDGDGNQEVVGAGNPTFAIGNDGNPLWSMEAGCSQAIVADFALDDKLDVMCNRGSSIHIYTHDHQKVWSLDPKVSVDFCRAGDVNGDLKMDIECKFARRDRWFRVSSEGKLLSNSTEDPEIPEGAVDLDEATPVSKEVWTGEREYDLNGDGATEESIQADGSAIVVQSRSKKSAVARTDLGDEVRAALVKNLDGKDRPEIVALTDSEIVVLNAEAEVQDRFPSDAGDYTRHPVAEFDSVYARKFSDNDKASKAIRDKKSDFAECYENQVRGELVVGIGQVILKGYIGEGGDMSKLELMHSAINDSDVQRCAKRVLRKVDFPEPASADDDDDDTKATINVVLKFSFEDRP